jgi:capsular exopolysaccharide synthesis family protein
VASAPERTRRGLVDPGTASAEPFRTLRLALQLSADTAENKAIVVTSALPEDGKSTVAANYALVVTGGRGSALLIDGDLRRPSQHEIFGVPRVPGLVELLATGEPLVDHVHRIPSSGLDLLTAGRPLPHSTDLASSPRMADLIREAQERYDHVIIDAPPVLGAANAEALSSHDGVSIVMVVPINAKRRPLMDALRRLDLVEANVAGIILNKAGRVPQYGY